MRPTYIRLDLAALNVNLARVRAFAPHQSVLAMVKANAYGHGACLVAAALQSAEAFGVASLDEALSLRAAGITQSITLMEGIFDQAELAEVIRQRFRIVVHHEAQLAMLENLKATVSNINLLHVWLKIDTGMHRLGIAPTSLPLFYQRLMALETVKKVGLMTHFANADRLDDESTGNQLILFNQLTQHLPGPKSLANSAGILSWPKTHGDWVRPGLMLYGVSPFAHHVGLDHGLQPVMTLTSHLIAIHQLNAGDQVGYGSLWTAPKAATVGIVAIGYGDGYPREASNGTPILVSGICCPLAGRVSMDMLAVDLSDHPKAQLGDEVVLWGKGLPVEEVAACAQASPYELLARLTARLPTRVD